MVVCHCNAVNDAAIRDEVARGALTAEQIAEGCGAGARCGGCRVSVDELVDRLLHAELSAKTAA